MDMDAIEQHLVDIKETQSAQGRDIAHIAHTLGDDDSGLVKRVGLLEDSRNRLWGAGALLASLSGFAEWLFHHKKGG